MRKNILKVNIDMRRKVNKNIREQKAITLIALIVTIVILLILAGISIAMLTGENGLLDKAKLAKENTIKAQENENEILGSFENIIEKSINESSREDNNEKIDLKAENLTLIGSKIGSVIDIPEGYKYVIIVNTYWTYTGKNCLDGSRLVDNTNSSILLSNSASDYSGNNGSGSWLIFSKIEDTTTSARFTMNGSDYNIIFGIKD